MTEPKVRKNTGNAGKGRPKGSPNKASADLKAAILGALDAAGGHEYLLRVALEDPKTFCTPIGKILPTQVTGPGDGPVQISRIETVIVDPKEKS
jgi:hypothetical protein